MTIIDWLLDSDPAIRWQVKRDLTDEPDEVVAAERARVATELHDKVTQLLCGVLFHSQALADGISVVSLCKDLGLSRRSLESVFRSVIGMGPGSYVRTLQLNHIRRDLLSEAFAPLSIGMIAARRGVWHWSRFSHHYRLLFGELPSQTRLRQATRPP